MGDPVPTSLELTTEDGVTERVDATRLVVAGYTGRDRAAVERHIRELTEAGVPPPSRVPSYYELSPSLLCQAEKIEVSGERTSGEVEPVLVFSESGPILTIGSDHTDRDAERLDVRGSKASCPKVVARKALRYSAVVDAWERCTLRSWAAGTRYQEGSLGLIAPPERVLEDFSEAVGPPEPGLVLYLGTIPLARDTFVFASSYEMALAAPSGHTIEFDYRVLRRT